MGRNIDSAAYEPWKEYQASADFNKIKRWIDDKGNVDLFAWGPFRAGYESAVGKFDDSLNEYQKMALVTACWQENKASGVGGLQPIPYCALGLAGEAGEVIEKVKKAYRNDGGTFDTEGLKLELGDVLWYLSNLAFLLGLDLADVARANITKVMSRKARGVTKGEGDNR